VSPPDPREAARKQVSQQLIAALEDAQAGQAMRDASPKDAPGLERSARRAYDAMQFDFPVRVALHPSFPRGAVTLLLGISQPGSQPGIPAQDS